MSKNTKYESDSIKKTNKDGTVEIYTKDGLKITVYPDGTKVTENSNGLKMIIGPDGNIKGTEIPKGKEGLEL